MHGGSTPASLRKAAARVEQEKAKQAVETYGLPRDVDPLDALLEELHRTAGHVAWLAVEVAALEESNLAGVLVGLYQAERKHLTDVARTCIQAGIAERQVRIAEAQGMVIATAIKGILAELGIAERVDIGPLVRKHLTMVSGG